MLLSLLEWVVDGCSGKDPKLEKFLMKPSLSYYGMSQMGQQLLLCTVLFILSVEQDQAASTEN